MFFCVGSSVLVAGATAQEQIHFPACWQAKKNQIKNGRVTHIPDIWTLKLEEGTTLKPAGYKIPLITPNGPIKSEQLAAVEKNILDLIQQRYINKVLFFLPDQNNKKQQKDRHGRIVAHITNSKQSWAEFIISSGLGVFDTDNQLASCDRNLQIAETFAERQKLGFWRNKTVQTHPVFTTETQALLKAKGEDVIVRGEVLSVGIYANKHYLNFGQNWNYDFTVEISAKLSLELFGKADYIKNLIGQNVKIRGRLRQKGGPMIEIKKRNQLEIVLSE